MSIEITIVADNVADLRTQIAALAAMYPVNTTIPVSNGGTGTADPVAETTKPAPKKTTKAATKPAEEPAAPEPETPAEEPAPQPEEATKVPAMDFDKDVAPVVLRVVAERSKARVSEILEQFGVARASELDESRWPELVKTLEAELA